MVQTSSITVTNRVMLWLIRTAVPREKFNVFHRQDVCSAYADM